MPLRRLMQLTLPRAHRAAGSMRCHDMTLRHIRPDTPMIYDAADARRAARAGPGRGRMAMGSACR